jgi:hypothetical protein
MTQPGLEDCKCILGPRNPETGNREPVEINPECPVHGESAGESNG